MKEIKLDKIRLIILKNNLQKIQNEMRNALKSMNQADTALTASLKGKTRETYQESAKKVSQELEKSIEALYQLIAQMDQANETMYKVDYNIGKQMILNT